MNKKQRIVLGLLASVIFLMLLFPPFYVEIKSTTINKGYGFILAPPKHGYLTASVNTGMLIVQWIGALLLGGIAWFFFRDGQASSTRPVEARSEVINNETVAKLVSDDSIDQSRKFLGGKYHPWRRFFARMVDVSILGTVLLFTFAFIVGILFPENLIGFSTAIENKVISGFLVFLLWLPFEAILLSSTGTTLGKWVFGIRVLSLDGSKLLFSGALKRTLLVWIQGIGFGIPFIAIFTQFFGYRRLTRTGATLWDRSVNSMVTHKEWGLVRGIICFLSIISVWFLLSLLNTLGTK